MKPVQSLQYSILNQVDESNHKQRRYAATVILHNPCTQDNIEEIVREVSENLSKSNYCRNTRVAKIWGDTPAHAVRLFIANSDKDVETGNWICKSYWKNQSNGKNSDLKILWNEDKVYFSLERVLKQNDIILDKMLTLSAEASSYFKQYTHNKISEELFVSKIQELCPIVNTLYSQSDEVFIPNQMLTSYIKSCKNIFSIIHDMFYYHSNEGISTWPKTHRDALMQVTIKRFHKDYTKLDFLRKNLYLCMTSHAVI